MNTTMFDRWLPESQATQVFQNKKEKWEQGAKTTKKAEEREWLRKYKKKMWKQLLLKINKK